MLNTEGSWPVFLHQLTLLSVCSRQHGHGGKGGGIVLVRKCITFIAGDETAIVPGDLPGTREYSKYRSSTLFKKHLLWKCK